MLIILLGALHQTIVSVSLPQMVKDLGSPLMLAWFVAGYLLALSMVIPVHGKLGDLYRRRLLLTVAFAILLADLVAHAMACSMPMLIAAGIFQGIGGGRLISTVQAIVSEVVPLRERGRY